MAVKPRGFETVRDMVLSMAVVGGVVLALFLVVVWQRPEVQGPIRPGVDVPGVVDQVQLSAPFAVLEPTDLPDGWSPTSAWFDGPTETVALNGSVLHIGYQTPSGSYAEVKQTNGSADYAVAEWTDDAQPDGTVDIGGRTWHQVQSPETGKKGLVLETAGSERALVVVTGKADWPELHTLASSLE